MLIRHALSGSRRSLRAVGAPLTGLLLVGLVAAGCGSSSPSGPAAKPSAGASDVPAAGTCLADRVDGEPGWDTVVSCSQPHTYEVMGSIDLPSDMAVEDRQSLESGDTELRNKYLTFANQQCGQMRAEAFGLSGLDVGGVSATTAGLSPDYAGQLSLALSPSATWDKTKKLVCSVRWEEEGGTVYQVSSTNDDPSYKSFATGAFPSSGALCESYLDQKSGSKKAVPCADAHLQDDIVSFNVGAVLGKDWVTNVGTRDLTDAEWSQLDAICKPLVTSLLGSQRLQGKRIMADLGAQWGASKFIGDFYQIHCMIRGATNGNDLTGSVLATS